MADWHSRDQSCVWAGWGKYLSAFNHSESRGGRSASATERTLVHLGQPMVVGEWFSDPILKSNRIAPLPQRHSISAPFRQLRRRISTDLDSSKQGRKDRQSGQLAIGVNLLYLTDPR